MIFKEKDRNIIFGYIAMIIASILGLKAQGITYYIYNNIIEVDLTYLLTSITIITLLLFWLPQILIYKRNQSDEIKGLSIYLSINILVGLIISFWSIFVMIMWWG